MVLTPAQMRKAVQDYMKTDKPEVNIPGFFDLRANGKHLFKLGILSDEDVDFEVDMTGLMN